MKDCKYCGSVYYGEEKFCKSCGTQLEERYEPDRALCVTSLVFGILGWGLLLPVISPVVSLITGKAALRQGESKLAKAGVALSVVSLSFTVLLAALLLLSLAV